MDNQVFIFPKKSTPVFYVISAFLFFFSALMLYSLVNSYPHIKTSSISYFIIMVCFFVAFFSLRKTGKITTKSLLSGWDVLFFNVLKNEVPIETFNSILISRKIIAGGHAEGASTRSGHYSMILADNAVYDFDTWVITPSIAKRIYDVSDHYSFNVRNANSFEKCKNVAKEISKVTGIKVTINSNINDN